MRLKVIGACMAAMSICLPVSQAQTATIGEAIKVTGDIVVIENICPEIYKNIEAMRAYMEANGLTESLMTETNIFSDELERAAVRSFETRKTMSIADNCKDALNLYGENGAIVKGVLELKASGIK